MNINIHLFKNVSRELFLLSKLKLNSNMLIKRLDRAFFNILVDYSSKSFADNNKNTSNKGGGFQKSSKSTSQVNIDKANSISNLNNNNINSNSNTRSISSNNSNSANNKPVNLRSKFILVNENKEVLLYYSKFPFLYNFLFHLKYQLSLICLITFIKLNPLYIILPAAMPIVVFSIPILLIKYLSKLKERRYLVDEIWLDRNGQELILKYKESLFRLKSPNSDLEVLTINNIKNIPTKEAKKRFGGDPFPEDLLVSGLDNFHLFWKKYYSYSKHLMLYKYPVFIDYPTLVDALNGSNINIPESINVYLISSGEGSKNDLASNLSQFSKELRNE